MTPLDRYLRSRRIRYWSWCPACDWALSWSDDERLPVAAFDQHEALGGDHRAYVETQSERVARLERYAFATWLNLRILMAPKVYKYQLPEFLWIRQHWSKR